MDARSDPALSTLRKGDVLTLAGAPGRGIAVFTGQVWLTQYNDPRDIVVGAGETFAFDRRGLVVVNALSDASLLLFDSAHAVAAVGHD